MIIRRRSKAREVALQALFQLECPRRSPFPYEEFVKRRLLEDTQLAFCRQLVMGSRAYHREIDDRISQAAENWRISRMAGIDRNILRMAAYELLFQPATAGRVVIDEALELAKKFGSLDSAKFVNGVLDRLWRGIPARSGEFAKPSPEKSSTDPDIRPSGEESKNPEEISPVPDAQMAKGGE
jgi:N utilization substance protein B